MADTSIPGSSGSSPTDSGESDASDAAIDPDLASLPASVTDTPGGQGGQPTIPEAEVGEASAPTPAAELEVTNAELAELIRGIRGELSAFAERSSFYEQLVRQLQARVEILQTDQTQQLLGPVFQRLASLLTDSAGAAEGARAQQGDFRADIEFDYFTDAILETLDLMAAQSVEAKVGDTFDRARHASLNSVPTLDQSLDWTLAKVVRQGIIRHGAERAFIPAKVTVYRYDATSATAPAQTDKAQIPVTTNSQPDQEGRPHE